MKHDYPKVSVVWADHWCERGDFEVEDVVENVKTPYMGEYTGYLVGESKRMIAIASNIWDDGGVSDPMYIMKRAIIKLEYLSTPENVPQKGKALKKPS